MPKLERYSIAVIFSILLTGCSTSVSANKLGGTFTAKYPFGISTLTLNNDGSFVQKVEIEKEKPATVRGTWSFDSQESTITLRGAMSVVDGHGNLNVDWRNPTDLPFQPVERLWMKVNIETSQEYPYIKN